MMKEDTDPALPPSVGTIAIPEASPEENATSTTKPSTSKPLAPSGMRRKQWLGVLAAFLLVVILVLAITLPLTLGRNKNQPSSSQDDGEATSSSTKQLVAKVPTFDQGLVEGYASQEDFEQGVYDAVLAMSTQVIHQNRPSKQSGMSPMMYARPTMEMDATGTGGPPMMATSQAGTGGSTTTGTTDFATNTQEDSMDEADIIKADANFVYAAYGDYLLVWDANGKQVAQVAMPPIEGSGTSSSGSSSTMGMGMNASASGEAAASTKSMMPPMHWNPKPRIDALLLTEKHVVVIVSGYAPHRYEQYDTAQQQPQRPILYDYRNTQIRLYEKATDNSGQLTLVGSSIVNGNYLDARSTGDVVHVVTTSGLDLWAHLWQPLEPTEVMNVPYEEVYQEGFDEDLYMALAMEVAKKELIPQFARKLQEELALSNSNDLPDLLRINQWHRETPILPTDDGGDDSLLPPMIMNDLMNQFAQVTSFDVNNYNNEELAVSASAYLSPNSFGHLYGTDNVLMLATQGWDWFPMRQQSTPSTYLVALEVNGASTQFSSVGTVPGHLLNSYALDVLDGQVRAATTLNTGAWWWGGPVVSFANTDVAMVEDAAQVESTNVDGSTPGVFERCPPPSDDGSGCINEENHQQCLDLLDNGCRSILVMESCPLQYGCADADVPPTEPETPPLEESRTENYMIVLDIQPGAMQELGRVQIGEPNEQITAVRFFDNVAYAVTFEQTDPFYVLDMTVPKVVGELKLPGFSSYLHSMNDDNTLLVAVGQNATEDGRQTGLMVTVFDARDPTNPQALVSHTFVEADDPNNAHTSSAAQWDYKAFRYLRDSGKLVIPVQMWRNRVVWQENREIYMSENFEGFAVLNVSTTSISEQFRVSHSRTQDGTDCFYCDGGYLPPRSFVYNGDLMTVQNNIVASTNLDTADEVWRTKLQVQGESSECCW